MNEEKDIPVASEAPPPLEIFPDLKTLREASGLSLQDVLKMTRVSLVNLKAVEHSDFKNLPPPVYARNFIRQYARTVGIDEKLILGHYERHLESLKPPHVEMEVRKPWPKAGRRDRFLFMSLAAVIIAGILVSVIFLYYQVGTPPSPVPAVAVESPTAPVAPTLENTTTFPTPSTPEMSSGSAGSLHPR